MDGVGSTMAEAPQQNEETVKTFESLRSRPDILP